MVELIIFRHPETRGDRVYVRHGDIFVPYATGRRFLKGQSDKVLYRLTHRGILEAYQTASRIKEFHQPTDKPIRIVDLWRNKSIRSSEGEEITKVVLMDKSRGGSVQDIRVRESDYLLERCFGSIEGEEISKLEEALGEAKKIGKIPEYYTLDDALIYCDNFKIFEDILKIPHKKDAESFQHTLERAVKIMKEIVEESADARYAQIFVHKVFAPYLIAAVDILELNNGIVPAIRGDLDRRKRLWLRPYFLDSSRFARIGIQKLGEKNYWVNRYHEVNDGGHLKGIAPELTTAHIKRANQIRISITPWYKAKKIPVEVETDEIPPFYMHGGDRRKGVEIYSPIELPELLSDKEKIPDSFIQFHFVDQPRRKSYDFSVWIEKILGDKPLANLIMEQSISFVKKNTLPTEIRQTLTSTINKYYSGR